MSFDFEVKQRKETEDIDLSHIPAELRRSLVAHLHKDLLFSVTFLRTLRRSGCVYARTHALVVKKMVRKMVFRYVRVYVSV